MKREFFRSLHVSKLFRASVSQVVRGCSSLYSFRQRRKLVLCIESALNQLTAKRGQTDDCRRDLSAHPHSSRAGLDQGALFSSPQFRRLYDQRVGLGVDLHCH